MSVTISYPTDKQTLKAIKEAGYTHLSLWYADTPAGPWSLASPVTVTPATIQQAIDDGVDTIGFFWGSGNHAMWFKVVPYVSSTYAPLNDSRAFHGGGGTTLAVLRRQVGELTNDMVATETTASGTTSQLTASSIAVLRYPDRHFEGFFIRRLDTGESSIVQSYTRSSAQLTVSPAFQTAVPSGAPIELTRRWMPDEYRYAINMAISSSYPVLSRTITRTMYHTGEGEFSYEVPADIREVARVEIDDYVGSYGKNADIRDGQPWREIPFGVVTDGLLRKLEFKRQLPYVAGPRRLRITGTGPLSQVWEDSDWVDVVEPQTNLIVALAAHYLYSLLPPRSASSDREFYESMAKYYLSLYSEMKMAFRSGRPPRRIWTQEPRWRAGGDL